VIVSLHEYDIGSGRPSPLNRFSFPVAEIGCKISAGWSPNHAMNGVRVFAPHGTALGAIVVPEVAANLCFGGHHHNRLFICTSTSIYAMDVGTRGVEL
jgi:hypothetical protein